MDKRRLFTIFIIVFVDLLGFSLILPLLPYYAETFGANATVTGFLVASYALAQLLGAPLLGRLSDRIGRRPVLLVSIFGTFLGFMLLGAARSLWMLFAARIIDGLTGGNISVAQAYITDVTDDKNRAKALGMIGAAFGLGFIIGPAVGGLLSTFGYAIPAFAAAALSFANLASVYLFLPESLTPASVVHARGVVVRAQSPARRAAVAHAIVLCAGFGYLPNRFHALCSISPGSRCARDGVGAGLRRRAGRCRAGRGDWVADQALQRKAIDLYLYCRDDAGAGCVGVRAESMDVFGCACSPFGGDGHAQHRAQ